MQGNMDKLAALSDLLALRRHFAIAKDVAPGEPPPGGAYTGGEGGLFSREPIHGRVVNPHFPDDTKALAMKLIGRTSRNLYSRGGGELGFSLKQAPIAAISAGLPPDTRRAATRHETVHQMLNQLGRDPGAKAPTGMRAISWLQRHNLTEPLGAVLEEAAAHGVGGKHLPAGHPDKISMPGFLFGMDGRALIYAQRWRQAGQRWRARVATGLNLAPIAAVPLAALGGLGAYHAYRAWTPNEPEEKKADLLPSVATQEHQQQLIDEAEAAPQRKLLYHALGSGKTLSAIGMAEARNKPYLAVTPASIRQNFKNEQEKFTTGNVPSEVLSYTQLAGGHRPQRDPYTLIFDEAQRLRNPATQQSRVAAQMADKARQLIMLSGTPVVNDPSDLAVPLSMLTGNRMTPARFREKFVREKEVSPGIWGRLRGVPMGKEEDIHNANQLKALLKGHVDYYAPPNTTVPVKHEDIHTDMGKEQSQIYKAMWDQLPWHIRWKLKNDFPMNSQELQRSVSFLTGPRQVSLSPYPYMKEKDPLKAFHMSGKLQHAHTELAKHLQDPRQKALIFSNFIDAGLVPYAAKLQEQGIPHGVFHGGLNDASRKKLVEDFNTGKTRVALLGPSGTEGLSFRGVQLVQVLDPYWNPTRGQQAEGRGLRFDSHSGLPEDLQNIKIQRFVSKMPLGFSDRMLSGVGFDRSQQAAAADTYLEQMSQRKKKLNDKFLHLLQEVGTRKEVA